jgi:hypothetical protein
MAPHALVGVARAPSRGAGELHLILRLTEEQATAEFSGGGRVARAVARRADLDRPTDGVLEAELRPWASHQDGEYQEGEGSGLSHARLGGGAATL